MAKTPDEPPEVQPVYWFCLLDQAIEHGDVDLAAQCRRELARLGVDVSLRGLKLVPPKKGGTESV